MTISTVDIIMGRIASATPESPIAVFLTLEENKLNAVFAATTETKKRLKSKNLVGVFHNKMSEKKTKQQLSVAAQMFVKEAA